MIEVHDNALESHVAELIDMQLRDVSWKYNYDSVKNGVNKHWHVFCGHNTDDCYDNGYDYLIAIWNVIKKHKPELDMERVYLNAHTHGIEPHRHIDDGDYTIIYYPRLDWKTEWGGGTLIVEDGVNHLVDYKPNSLVIFDANLMHSAQVVSKSCHELRTVVVFKCDKDVVV